MGFYLYLNVNIERMEYLFLILFIIIISFLIINRYTLLFSNINLNSNNNNNFIINEYSYLNKYSSVDLLNLENLKNIIYYNIIDTISIDEKKIIELIINDINKTKFNNNFKKLNNIYLIIKKINDNFKIIIFYDGLLHNYKKLIFNEDDFSKKDLIYKLDLKHKLFNHYLQ